MLAIRGGYRLPYLIDDIISSELSTLGPWQERMQVTGNFSILLRFGKVSPEAAGQPEKTRMGNTSRWPATRVILLRGRKMESAPGDEYCTTVGYWPISPIILVESPQTVNGPVIVTEDRTLSSQLKTGLTTSLDNDHFSISSRSARDDHEAWFSPTR